MKDFGEKVKQGIKKLWSKVRVDFKAYTKNNKKLLFIELAVVVGLVAIDFITKFWAFSEFWNDGAPAIIDVIPRVFYLTAHKNTGMAFGAFQGNSLLLGIFSLIVCVALVWYLLKAVNEHKLLRIGLLLVFAGGFANGMERVIWQFVRDFIGFPWWFNTVLNIADIFIVVGGVLVIIYLLFIELPKDSKKAKSQKLAAEQAGTEQEQVSEGQEEIEKEAEERDLTNNE